MESESKEQNEISISKSNTTSKSLPEDVIVGPFSYLDPIRNQDPDRCAAPKYLSLDELNQPKANTKKEIFAGQEITPTGELKLIDEDALRRQRGVVANLVKQFASQLIKGKSAVTISLPIRIFEPRSFIERICDWWAFAPTFLTKAAQEKDPVERMKYVIAFAISGLHYSARQIKPFNPLLGETYQGTFEDGTEISCEHTSHHPPVTSFYLTNPLWKFYGRYELKGELSKNTLVIHQDGPNVVDFRDGHKIRFHYPIIKSSGMLMGDRTVRFAGLLLVYDNKNKNKALVRMNAEKGGGFGSMFSKTRTDNFRGRIFQFDPNVPIKKKNDIEEEFDEHEKMKDLVKELHTIEGSWLENLVIDNKEYWHVDKFKPSMHKFIENPLPSDARYREDLIWLKYGNEDNAQNWKLKLELQQRHERNLRNKIKEEAKKNANQ